MQNNHNNSHADRLTAIASNRESIVSSKITAVTGLLLCIAVLLLSGCVTSGTVRTGDHETLASQPVYLVAKAGNQCHYLNEEISDVLEYAKKFNRSQYAYYYQALSRERLLAIENRAKQADCKYLTMPAETRLHNLASL